MLAAYSPRRKAMRARATTIALLCNVAATAAAAAAAASAAAAAAVNPALCARSVVSGFNALSFSPGHQTYYEALCRNPLKATSVYATAIVRCHLDDLAPVTDHADDQCVKYGGFPMLRPEEVADGLTEDAIARMRVVDLGEIPQGELIDEPALLSEYWFDLAWRSADAWDYSLWARSTYGLLIYVFWAAVCLIKGLDKLVFHLYDYSYRRTRRTAPGSISRRLLAIPEALYRWNHRHLAVPNSFELDHGKNWLWSSVPTRMEAIIVIAYWVLSIVTCCISYRVFPDNLNFGAVDKQLWRYIADRTGELSYANLTLLFLFGLRNNTLMWATGWQYKHFNLFHRHIARVATLQAIVHSVGYTVLYLQFGDAASYFLNLTIPWFYMGIAGTVAMSLLIIFSIMWFRVKYFEPFMLFHIAMSVVTIAGLFKHTSIFHGEWEIYLWPPAILWILDRMARILRVIYCNINVRVNGLSIDHSKTAIHYVPGADIIEIHVTLPGVQLKAFPGHFYYLSQPFSWTAYEGHPFSLVSWGYAKSKLDEEDSTEEEPLLSRISTVPQGDDEARVDQPSTRLTFWARPYDGWTRRLRNQAMEASTKSLISNTIFLEGPYGHHERAYTYDRLLLIAGGTGIAGLAAYMLEYARLVNDSSQEVRTTGIDLVWTCRQEELIRHIAMGDLAEVLSRPEVDYKFYATRPPTGDLEYNEDDPDKSLVIRQGRPDLSSMIEDAARQAVDSSCSLAVMVCGPGAMASTARTGTHASLKKHTNLTMDYFEETFG